MFAFYQFKFPTYTSSHSLLSYVQLAAKAVPTMDYFLQFLAVNKDDIEKPDFEKILVQDLEECAGALTKLTNILQEHYERDQLETEEIV